MTEPESKKRKMRQHLSVDTRLAAKAIFDDDSIGRVAVEPAPRGSPVFMDWLLRARIRLTLGICLIMALVTILPVWFELGHRDRTTSLQHALTIQGKKLVGPTNRAKLQRWFTEQDVDALRKHYLKLRPQLLAGLKNAGFSLDPKDLRVRVDYGRKTLLLGAKVDQGDKGVFMTWGDPKDLTNLRSLPQATLGAVLSENRDLLTLMGVIVGLSLLFVWMVPAFYRRKKEPEQGHL